MNRDRLSQLAVFVTLVVGLSLGSCSGDSPSTRDASSDGAGNADAERDAEDARDVEDGRDADASPEPPDTDADRFADTECYGRGTKSAGIDSRCEGNRGCLELDARCGECACTLCADEYCVEETCDDGGSPECPGGPFVDTGDADGG